MSPLEQARRIAALAQEKLAEDVIILDMRPVCTYTDFFVVATGRNARQTQSIEDEVHGHMTVPGVVPKLSRTPGSIRTAARWTVGADTDAVLAELEPERGRDGLSAGS